MAWTVVEDQDAPYCGLEYQGSLATAGILVCIAQSGRSRSEAGILGVDDADMVLLIQWRIYSDVASFGVSVAPRS